MKLHQIDVKHVGHNSFAPFSFFPYYIIPISILRDCDFAKKLRLAPWISTNPMNFK